MLTHSDGLVAHIETRYNNIFIIKRRSFLFLTTRFRREDHIQSVVNLKDPDDMMAPYTRIVSVALVYPETIQRILMVGLGAGSISTYIARAMPDVHIDAVEVDPGVIAAGRRYFGLKETGRVRFIESDGRTYLSHKKELYDIVLLDAFRELGVPSDLRTREFYKLVKEHLAPHGVAVFNIAVGPKSIARLWYLCAKCFRLSISIPIGPLDRKSRRSLWLCPLPSQARALCCNAPVLCRTGFISDILCLFCLEGGRDREFKDE